MPKKHNGLITNSTTFITISLSLFLRVSLIIIFLLYLVILVITQTGIKDKLSSTIITSVSELIPKETLLSVLAEEITPLRVSNAEMLSKQIDWVEIATNINLSDQRSLLGGEISGIKNYHTEIAVAGSGTDITNLPAESPPPSEAQLNNQSINQVQLDEAKEDTDEEIKEIADKSVYIYHSHSWEAFNPLLKNSGPHDAASRNEKVNVLAVGKKLKLELAKRGIGAVHDKTDVTSGLKERNWNYTQSYAYSRERVQEAMAQNNHLNYLIDIHRDSQPKEVTTKTIHGKEYARLFFVVGKENENFQENLATAKELNKKLEAKYPGISRGVFVKTKSEGNGVYNQDLTERAMLLEFGGVDNNLTELYNSIEAFAEVFSDYYWKDAMEVNGG